MKSFKLVLFIVIATFVVGGSILACEALDALFIKSSNDEGSNQNVILSDPDPASVEDETTGPVDEQVYLSSTLYNRYSTGQLCLAVSGGGFTLEQGILLTFSQNKLFLANISDIFSDSECTSENDILDLSKVTVDSIIQKLTYNTANDGIAEYTYNSTDNTIKFDYKGANSEIIQTNYTLKYNSTNNTIMVEYPANTNLVKTVNSLNFNKIK